MSSDKKQPMRITRRDALRLAGGAGAAAMLTRHGGIAVAQDASGQITIPDSGVQLPTDDVTFRWIDSGDLKAIFYNQLFAAYQEKHPNITIQYDPLPWAEIGEIVPLGVQNGEAHDVFAKPMEIPAAQMVRDGWVAPLDDIIPNFAQWKERFPLGTLLEGVHIFNGKTYTFPVTSDKRYSTLTIFHPTYMQQAGYDFASKPPTWDEFRAAAKKITEQGGGQYYGLLIAGKEPEQFGNFVRTFARMAGASAGNAFDFTDIDWRTGKHIYASDQFVAALDLLLAMNADGSIFPGALSLGGFDARARFPTGVAGMILTGPWDIANYQRDAPDFEFDVASSPLPNSGQPVPLTYEEVGANLSWVYANSPNKAIAGDLFSYIGSNEGQIGIMSATKGLLRSLFPDAAKTAQETLELDPLADKALTLFDQQMRLGPMVAVRNPDAVQIAFERKPLQPNFGQTIQGLFSGQISDPRAALQDLQDRADAELDRAIKAAQDKGAQVSRDDFVFPNWDPTKDYTEADYAAL
jgi:multiple sugar transport system substrate-binding protein